MSIFPIFKIPEEITGSQSDLILAKMLIQSWKICGLFQIEMNHLCSIKTKIAFSESKIFFQLPLESKIKLKNDLTYSGYFASKEEITAGKADFPEVFTLCKDTSLNDFRVTQKWPCHGPVPWPSDSFKNGFTKFKNELGNIGDNILKLIAIGLGLNDINTLTKFTHDGWHHLRILKYPEATLESNNRGIGSHSDYGLLLISIQDSISGLYIRPPIDGEPRKKNWLTSESSAGIYENEEPWILLDPKPNLLAVFPGDIFQFLTDGYFLSTLHKVKLSTKERYSFAYFHEPNFQSSMNPLLGSSKNDFIHYGTHFTNMHIRSYPERKTTKRMISENYLTTFQ